jgi:hypothetical protein
MKDVSSGFPVFPVCSHEEPLEKEDTQLVFVLGDIPFFWGGGVVLIFRSKVKGACYDVMISEFLGNG